MAGLDSVGNRGRRGTQRQRLTLFDGKRKQQHGITWRDVDNLKLRAAIAQALAAGATISFTPAAGGMGCMVKIWQGDYQASEFAGSIEEVNELLAIVAEGMCSKAEDPYEPFKPITVSSPMAAD